MSRLAHIIERAIAISELDWTESSTAAPEVVALAALVSACVNDPILARRAAQAESLDEVLDCLAADRILSRAELPVAREVLSGVEADDLLRTVLDRVIRS